MEAVGFCREHATAERSKAVVAAAGVVVAGTVAKLLDKPALNQLLQIVVKSSGAQFVFPLGLTSDLPHDGVAVKVIGS